MMTMVAFGGLVVTAQLNPMAVSYNVDKVVVAFGMTALVLAIEVDRFLNGLTRPFWGWVSDHIGRENTMFIAFMLEAIAVFALLQLIHRPLWFIVLSGLCFFAWGDIFSLFPSHHRGPVRQHVGDDQLRRRLYRQGSGGASSPDRCAAGCLPRPVPGAKVFWVMIACDLVAALLALLWLKPLAARTIAKAEAMAASSTPQVVAEQTYRWSSLGGWRGGGPRQPAMVSGSVNFT